MRELIETGKTVDEAAEKALAQLGLSREDVSVEVLEMPVKKFIGSKPAKIKVIVLGEEEPDNEPKEQQKTATLKPEIKTTEETVKPMQAQKQEQPAAVIKEEPAVGEKVDEAVAFLTDVCKKMGVEDVTVTPVKVGENVILKVNGEDVGVLIGRRGETMEALSYLTGLTANRSGGDYQKFSLDVAGYRSKREQDLVVLAKRIGAKVAKTGRSHMLEPMNPYERRIIHSAISEMENVKSESTGEGAGRRIVISCTGANAKKGFSSNSQRQPNSSYRGDRSNSSANAGKYQGGKPRREGGYSKPKTEYKERTYNTAAAPTAYAPKTETIDDAVDIGLYGKIEL